MEQTRNEDDSRRKKARDETPKKGGFKKNKDKISSRKIDHRILCFFLVQKYRYGDYEKRVKKKYEKRSRTKERERKWGKTEEDTQKRRWRKKVKETCDREKRERETLRQEIKKEWRKERREKGEKSKKGWTKEWKGKVNKEKSDDRNRGTCWKMKTKQKRDGTKTKNEGFFGADFFCGLKWREKRIKKKKNKNRGKSNFFFSHAMFFKTKRTETENNRKFFPHFPAKTRFFFLDTSKKKESKKKKQSSKYEAKETRVIQNEKSFFQTEKRPNMEKLHNFWKSTTKKETEKTKFFFFLMEERRLKRRSWQKPKKIFFFVAQRVWLQETWRYLKDPKKEV